MTCPETVLDLKNTVEHSAFINNQAVTVAKGGAHCIPERQAKALSWG